MSSGPCAMTTRAGRPCRARRSERTPLDPDGVARCFWHSRAAMLADVHLGALHVLREYAAIEVAMSRSYADLTAKYAVRGVTRESLLGLPLGSLPPVSRGRYEDLHGAFAYLRYLNACDSCASVGAVIEAQCRACGVRLP